MDADKAQVRMLASMAPSSRTADSLLPYRRSSAFIDGQSPFSPPQHAMPDREFGFETLCLHAGQIPDAQTGSRAVPLYQTTACGFQNAEPPAGPFKLAR